MNKILIPSLALSTLLIACKSTDGVGQSEQASTAMTDMKQAMSDAPSRITAVTTALTEIRIEGGDMKAEFTTFDKHVDETLAHRELLRSLSDKVERNKSAYIASWQQRAESIQDEELRRLADERRATVMLEFEEVKQAVDGARAEFEPWMQKVVDVRTYLESDLNAAGVASIDVVIERLTEDSEGIKEKIQVALDRFDRMGGALVASKESQGGEAR